MSSSSENLELGDLRIGVWYVVTHDSVDREFQVGDRIRLRPDGSIDCREALGWMPAEDVPAATRGMTAQELLQR